MSLTPFEGRRSSFRRLERSPRFPASIALLSNVAKDATGKWIADSGVGWGQHFDFTTGSKRLIEKDQTSEYIVDAGSRWENGFDYRRALHVLRKLNSLCLKEVQERWPMGVEEIKEKTAKIREKATKMPKKPSGLKE